MVTNILLTLVVLSNVVVISLLIRAFRASRNIYDNAIDFITTKEDGKPSPFSLFMDSLASILARAIMAQAKTTFMGMQSGESRAQKAIQGDIAEGIAGTNPLIGGVMNMFPALRKSLRRNPGLVDMAIGALASKFASKGNNSGIGVSPKFKL